MLSWDQKLVYRSLRERLFLFLSGAHLGVELLSHVAALCLAFQDPPDCFQSGCTISIPSSRVEGSDFSTFSPALGIWLSDCGHPGGECDKAFLAG